MQNQFLKTKGGYTIIETMIAISLFLIIIVIGMSALLNANLLHKKSQNMRSIMDNLSFVMEDMSRAFRTGYNYHCFVSGDAIPQEASDVFITPRSCKGGWGIALEASNGDSAINTDQWVYYIGDGKLLKKSTGTSYAIADFVQLTPDEVYISPTSSFSVLGAEKDSQQPFVIIRLVGTITTNGVESPFSLETTVSQRLLDS